MPNSALPAGMVVSMPCWRRTQAQIDLQGMKLGQEADQKSCSELPKQSTDHAMKM
jgi:hypothetical protein